jgi:hypothetical protein
MQPLDDGTYDAFVIDAKEDDEEIAFTRLQLTITSGARKGEVVNVRASQLSRDALELLGLPATLTVKDGQPSVSFDD